MALRVEGQQKGQLRDILCMAFDEQSFEEMLDILLRIRLNSLTSTKFEFPTIVYNVITKLNLRDRTDELIAAARLANPTNVALNEFAQQFDLTPLDKDEKPQQIFQRILKPNQTFLNPVEWRKKMGEIETRICRIKIQANPSLINGTGFLVGSDLVLTNYHVVEAVIKGQRGEATETGMSALPADVACVFDYRFEPNHPGDKTILNTGIIHKLANQWLVDFSESFPLDQLPPSDCLDYALLRLEGAPGQETVGSLSNEKTRGWISFPAAEYEFETDSPVFIMQHPLGSPLKLAFATNGIIELNSNQTRVKHRVNTDGGSSGSPCFSQNWDLIALHHSGDQIFDPKHKPSYNEAIPLKAIRALMQQRKVAPLLGL